MAGLTSQLLASGRQRFLKDEPFEEEAGVFLSSSNGKGWHKKNGNFWKTQQKLKKSKKKIYWQKLNHYNLPFKRQ